MNFRQFHENSLLNNLMLVGIWLKWEYNHMNGNTLSDITKYFLSSLTE